MLHCCIVSAMTMCILFTVNNINRLCYLPFVLQMKVFKYTCLLKGSYYKCHRAYDNLIIFRKHHCMKLKPETENYNQ